MSKYADVADELTRPPIDTSFERLDVPMDEWLAHIAAEIRSLDVIRDGTEAEARQGMRALPRGHAARGAVPPLPPTDMDELGLGRLGVWQSWLCS